MSKTVKTIVIVFWIGFVGVIGGIACMFYFISQGKMGNLPPIEDLQDPKNKYASEIYSSDGKVLGRFFESKENRVPVQYRDLSPNLVEALIATEDVRFREHSGIDFQSLFRVFVKTVVLQQKNSGGGSTISQQLAKLLFTEEPATSLLERAKQKVMKEWIIAVKLEKVYTKQEIVAMYFNKFDFLNNAVGIKSAANSYFRKEPRDLSVGESALLVGMLKNPAYFNPLKESAVARCTERRNVVLDQMVKAGYLAAAKADSVKKTGLGTNRKKFKSADHKEGLAPYFREFLRKRMNLSRPDQARYATVEQYRADSTAWADDPLYGWCNKNLKPDHTKYNLYTDGLKIYTTIDSRMQRYAEEAVREYLGLYLQPLFTKEKKGRKNAPFSNSTRPGQRDTMLEQAMRLTDRYRVMKQNGASRAEIKKAFNTKVDMDVFCWRRLKGRNGKDSVVAGVLDTAMTPLDSLKYTKGFLRSGLVSIDIDGYVKAYVGGPDFDFFQYDMVTQGRRQVGSTIKPFLYALAMETGHTPCDLAPNERPVIVINEQTGETWSPKNVAFGEKDKQTVGSYITLKRGLQTSNNWISAYLIKQLKPEAFVGMLQAFGITSKLDPVYTLCLGVADVSIIEMAAAYTAFANKGLKASPIYVTRIEDNNGNVVGSQKFVPRRKEIIKQETAYKMIDMLRGVIDGGTGLRLRTRRYDYCIDWKIQVGGKTGTTQNNSDGWFMGFIPNLITSVWVGGENRDIHFDNIRNGQGSSTALPIWGKYMKKVFADGELNKVYSPDARFVYPYTPCTPAGGNGGANISKTQNADAAEEEDLMLEE